MSSSNAYTLKYNVKRALQPTANLAVEDRHALQRAVNECACVDKSVYAYCFVDFALFLRRLRSTRHDKHLLRVLVTRGVFFLTLRVVCWYELAGWLSQKHLESVANPILKRKENA